VATRERERESSRIYIFVFRVPNNRVERLPTPFTPNWRAPDGRGRRARTGTKAAFLGGGPSRPSPHVAVAIVMAFCTAPCVRDENRWADFASTRFCGPRAKPESCKPNNGRPRRRPSANRSVVRFYGFSHPQKSAFTAVRTRPAVGTVHAYRRRSVAVRLSGDGVNLIQKTFPPFAAAAVSHTN